MKDLQTFLTKNIFRMTHAQFRRRPLCIAAVSPPTAHANEDDSLSRGDQQYSGQKFKIQRSKGL